jgi:hypothetical protein
MQHIYSEDPTLRSSRMRTQLGLVTPRKEEVVGGSRPDEKSAYSLVDLYNGTPRKGPPVPKLRLDDDNLDGDKGALTMEALSVKTPEKRTRSRGKLTIEALETGSMASERRAAGSAKRPFSRGQDDGMATETDPARVSPATALSGSLTTMHLQ